MVDVMTDTRVGEYGREGRTYGQGWDWEGPYSTVSVPELHDFCRRAYLAAEAGMVGIMFTQTGPGVAPFGGYQPLLGNAPLAVGIPARDHDPVIMDLCFTQSSASGVLLAASQEGVTIPPGLLLDEHGNPTTNPRDFSDEEHTRAGSMRVKGTLTPLGNSHKGSAMVFVIGLLASLLSDTDPSWTLVGEGDERGV